MTDTAGDVNAKIKAVLAPHTTAIVNAGLTLAAAQAELARLFNLEINDNLTNGVAGMTSATLGFTLTDRAETASLAGISYTYDSVSKEVDVSIALLNISIDLTNLFASAFEGAVLPPKLGLNDTGSALTFSIAAIRTVTVGGDLQAIGFETRTYDVGNLLSLGATLPSARLALIWACCSLRWTR